MAQAVLKRSPVLALHRTGFECGCWIGAGRLQNYPPTGETGGAASALTWPGRRIWCLPPPCTTRKSSPTQGSCSVLLHQPGGRFAANPCCRHPAPGSPLLISDGDPTRGRAEPQRGYELSCWPFGFAGDRRWSQPPEQVKQDRRCQGDAVPVHMRADVPHCRERRTRANPPR